MKTKSRFSAVAALEHASEGATENEAAAIEAYGLRVLQINDVESLFCPQCQISVQGMDADLGNYVQCEYCGKELRKM